MVGVFKMGWLEPPRSLRQGHAIGKKWRLRGKGTWRKRSGERRGWGALSHQWANIFTGGATQFHHWLWGEEGIDLEDWMQPEPGDSKSAPGCRHGQWMSREVVRGWWWAVGHCGRWGSGAGVRLKLLVECCDCYEYRSDESSPRIEQKPSWCLCTVQLYSQVDGVAAVMNFYFPIFYISQFFPLGIVHASLSSCVHFLWRKH